MATRIPTNESLKKPLISNQSGTSLRNENPKRSQISVLRRSQTSSLTDKELSQMTMENKDSFPNPREGLAVRRFFNGMGYAFEGMKRVFTDGYLIFTLCQSLYVVPIFIIWLAACIGSAYGICALWNVLFLKDFEIPVIITITFVATLSMFFMILYGFLILRPILMIVLNQQARRLSYLVELKMNGFKVNARDLLCGEGGIGGPKLCSFEWFKGVILFIIDVIFRQLFMILLHEIKNMLGFLVMQGVAFLLLLIPGIGWILSLIMTVSLLAVQSSFTFFDMVMQRKNFSFFETMRTIWNNLSILAGMGLGFILLSPLIIFLFPAAIIACTRLFVHLSSHKQTGKYEHWLNIFVWYAISVSSEGIQFKQREEFIREALQKEDLEKDQGSTDYPSEANPETPTGYLAATPDLQYNTIQTSPKSPTDFVEYPQPPTYYQQ